MSEYYYGGMTPIRTRRLRLASRVGSGLDAQGKTGWSG